MVIQWYPGHMVKAKREILANLKLVDVVLELADARIPYSSRNPDISEIHRKPHVLVVTKGDLADEKCTQVWMDFWRAQGQKAVVVDVLQGKGIGGIVTHVKQAVSGMKRTPRVLVIGIPNVGKSSLINRLAKRSSAKVGAKPGVTRGRQWINADGFQLLDTPGILWPKFEDQEVARRLAVVSSIKDEIFDWEETAGWLLNFLVEHYWDQLSSRYKLTEPIDDLLTEIGRRRGCLQSGGIVDRRQAAQLVVQEFRNGKIGKVTLELPRREHCGSCEGHSID